MTRPALGWWRALGIRPGIAGFNSCAMICRFMVRLLHVPIARRRYRRVHLSSAAALSLSPPAGNCIHARGTKALLGWRQQQGARLGWF